MNCVKAQPFFSHNSKEKSLLEKKGKKKMAKQRFFMVFMSHIFRLRKLFFANLNEMQFESDLNRI